MIISDALPPYARPWKNGRDPRFAPQDLLRRAAERTREETILRQWNAADLKGYAFAPEAELPAADKVNDPQRFKGWACEPPRGIRVPSVIELLDNGLFGQAPAKLSNRLDPIGDQITSAMTARVEDGWITLWKIGREMYGWSLELVDFNASPLAPPPRYPRAALQWPWAVFELTGARKDAGVLKQLLAANDLLSVDQRTFTSHWDADRPPTILPSETLPGVSSTDYPRALELWHGLQATFWQAVDLGQIVAFARRAYDPAAAPARLEAPRREAFRANGCLFAGDTVVWRDLWFVRADAIEGVPGRHEHGDNGPILEALDQVTADLIKSGRGVTTIVELIRMTLERAGLDTDAKSIGRVRTRETIKANIAESMRRIQSASREPVAQRRSKESN